MAIGGSSAYVLQCFGQHLVHVRAKDRYTAVKDKSAPLDQRMVSKASHRISHGGMKSSH